ATPSPTETSSAETSDDEQRNAASCLMFAAVWEAASEVAEDGSTTKADWDPFRDHMDEVALSATGLTQERMLRVVDLWPSLADLYFGDVDEWITAMNDVTRICQT